MTDSEVLEKLVTMHMELCERIYEDPDNADLLDRLAALQHSMNAVVGKGKG